MKQSPIINKSHHTSQINYY